MPPLLPNSGIGGDGEDAGFRVSEDTSGTHVLVPNRLIVAAFVAFVGMVGTASWWVSAESEHLAGLEREVAEFRADARAENSTVASIDNRLNRIEAVVLNIASRQQHASAGSPGPNE